MNTSLIAQAQKQIVELQKTLELLQSENYTIDISTRIKDLGMLYGELQDHLDEN